MLVYRVFPYLDAAAPGEPGHPLYEHHPQRGGRIDHPEYYVWYLARHPEGACGESFGNIGRWSDPMFEFPAMPGARRAIGTYEVPDDLRICDLDDPRQLDRLGLRPTQVVTRNLGVTSAWGHRIWAETSPPVDGKLWQAVQWWSFHKPTWTILASWERPEFIGLEILTLEHPAIRAAAKALYRPL
ncbi:RES family NAD+ phosphorylase [Rhodococcus sp. NPDC058521]|uniref:RES family NAD+ phosphorylase n=1 Tax=Rhodococcus sp. NPDC058521 TaxID=3346536 RepID=UPI00366934B9